MALTDGQLYALRILFAGASQSSTAVWPIIYDQAANSYAGFILVAFARSWTGRFVNRT